MFASQYIALLFSVVTVHHYWKHLPGWPCTARRHTVCLRTCWCSPLYIHWPVQLQWFSLIYCLAVCNWSVHHGKVMTLFFCTDIHLFIPYHILMWSFQPNAAQQSLKHCRNVQLLPAQLNILRPTKLASIAQQLPEQNILSHHQACLDISWHHVDQTLWFISID